jgi:uncharacterized lipoprotein YbaY
MKQPVWFAVVPLLLALPLGCATSSGEHTHAGSASIRGVLKWDSTTPLPADAEAAVYLINNTWISETVDVMDSQTISPVGRPPIPFTLHYDPESIDQNQRYTIGARLYVNGKVLYQTRGALVLTKGGPSDHVELTLHSLSNPVP